MRGIIFLLMKYYFEILILFSLQFRNGIEKKF